MGLIRLIIFALVIWLVWRMIRNFQENQLKASNARRANRKIPNKNMVLCQYCSVHIPENEAVHHEDLWFCNEQHMQKYLAGGKG